MKLRTIKSLKGQNGAALVEFALILPILIILIMGIIEFSLLLYDKAVITNASREGARFGIVFRTDRPVASSADYDAAVAARSGEIEDVVETYCGNNLVTFAEDNEIVFNLPNGPCENSDANLIVDVSYRYDFLVFRNIINGLFGGAFPDGLTLNARTVMRCE